MIIHFVHNIILVMNLNLPRLYGELLVLYFMYKANFAVRVKIIYFVNAHLSYNM